MTIGRSTRWTRPVVTLSVLLAAPAIDAQEHLYLSALTEVQVGNLPDRSPRDLRTIYPQLNLAYTASGFQAGLRAENFGTDASGRNYNHLAQRFVRYNRGGLRVTAGHFFSIFGNGLLMHAFELPSVITQDRGWRRRYQLTRDLDGLQIGYKWDRTEVTLLRGTPVNSALPPGDLGGSERRDGTVQGGSLEVHPIDYLSGGIGLLQVQAADGDKLGATVHGRWRLAPLMQRLGVTDVYADLYGEYAQRDLETDRWFSLDRDFPRALYLSSTVTAGPWGLSLEYKDSWDFLISEINNPPTLIREHEAFLLNRDTHVLLAADESGIQTELSYYFTGGQAVTANFTRAERRQGPGTADNMDLQALFLQATSPLGEDLSGQLWADFSRDRILPTTAANPSARSWTGKSTLLIASTPTSSSRPSTAHSAIWCFPTRTSTSVWNSTGPQDCPQLSWSSGPPIPSRPAPHKRVQPTGTVAASPGRSTRPTVSTSLAASAARG